MEVMRNEPVDEVIEISDGYFEPCTDHSLSDSGCQHASVRPIDLAYYYYEQVNIRMNQIFHPTYLQHNFYHNHCKELAKEMHRQKYT